MRGLVKEARTAIENKTADKDALVKQAVAGVYRAASKNIITLKTASRRVSRIMTAAAAK